MFVLDFEHLKLYFSPKHRSGSFGSTCGFSKFYGVLTVISAGCHVNKLFICKKLSLVFFLVGICSALCMYVEKIRWIRIST